MRRIRKVRPFFLVGLFFFCLLLSGKSTSAPEASLVWFADHKSVRAIDPATGQVTRAVELAREPDALAVYPEDQSLWVLLDRRAVKLASDGAMVVDVDLGRLRPDIDRPEHLVLNPYDGAVWVAGGMEVIKLSAQGEQLAYWRAQRKIESLALDADGSLWVLAHRELLHLSPTGAALASVDLNAFLVGTERLAIDGLGGILWIADAQRLLRLNLHQAAEPPRIYVAPEPADDAAEEAQSYRLNHMRALSVHPLFGTVWVATFRHLRLFDRNGNHLKTVKLPPQIGIAQSMAFDAKSLSLWIGGSNGIARYTANGELIATVPVEKEAEHVAAAGFTLVPDVAVREPADGAITNNRRPSIRLSLGAVCSGSPCLLPDAYTRSLELDASLNGSAVGPLFSIEGFEASYVPPPLPEGLNTFAVRAIDLFGHASELATSRFTVDTVAPKFIALSPPDGSVVTQGAVVISGLLDDPSANVVLTDAAGSGVSMSNANFSFSVLLKAGLNTFALIARDPAGNEATVPLRITYNAVSVKITRPITGATLDNRSVIVSGDFQGPPNTGIAISGTLAQIFGNRFYANLSLETGTHTLTAVATTPGGATATDTANVTVTSPAFEPIEIVVEPNTGVAPLTVRFVASSNSAQPVAQLRIDTNGDGSSDKTVSNPVDPVDYIYTTPGVYEARVTAVDAAGDTSSQTVVIVVNDAQQMDQMFTAMWGGMNDALVRGDVAAATSFLNESAKRKYQPVFEALRLNFPEIVASYSPLRRVSVSGEIGEYAIVRTFNDQNRLYLIYFLRDADGVWRVDGM